MMNRKRGLLFVLFFFVLISMHVEVRAENALGLTTTKRTDDTVVLQWNPYDGAQKYEIYVAKSSEQQYVKQGEVPGTASTIYNCSNISESKNYYFRVDAVFADSIGNENTVKSVVKINNGNIVSTTHQKYTYAEMEKDIVELTTKYSGYLQSRIIGKTADNRNLYDLTLGNPQAPGCIVVQASIHAREYMTAQLVMEQMEYYLDHYDNEYNEESYEDIFNQVCVHIVPMSNPDGVTIAQKGFSGIRSTKLRKKLKKMTGSRYTNNWKANARGVDLNSQFDHNFVYRKALKNGSYAGYGGKKPVSENESIALVNLVKEVKPAAVINYHAMGNVIYCNYGASKKMQKKVYKLSGKIRSLTGYSYMGGISNNSGFANWLVCDAGIPSCTVEIGRSIVPVPISQFKTVWKQNKNVVAASAQLYE